MTKPNRNSIRIYKIILGLVGFLIPLVLLFWAPIYFDNLQPWVIGILSVAFMINFPVILMGEVYTIVHVVILGMGLLYGPSTAVLIAFIGILIGHIAKYQRNNNLNNSENYIPRTSFWEEFPISLGRYSLPLAISFFITGTTTGIASSPIVLGSELTKIIIVLVVFSIADILLFLLGYRINQQHNPKNLSRDLTILLLVEFLQVPFTLIALLSYPSLGTGILAALIGVPAIYGVLMYGVGTTRDDLERRVNDLSTLNNISQTLQSTLEMEPLLETIRHHVTELLRIDSFYVALLKNQEESLWYPLAIKQGERKHWPPRKFADRLTDRVILYNQPIMLSRDAQAQLEKIGLPAGEDSMNAWLGVPLITPEQTIGCLAVFSNDPAAVFDRDDLNLLTILSGQVSVAINNALLFEEAQHRADQLEKLNKISTLITASLNLEDVLSQVTESVSEVVGAKRSAIYLLDLDQNLVELAYFVGLSPAFANANRSFSVTDPLRGQVLRIGEPKFVKNVSSDLLGEELGTLLNDEGVSAYVDFPLTTPEGQIGILSVYFDEKQSFSSDQVEIIQTFASQAALAVSNARLHLQTDEALAERVLQLAIIDSVSREISAAVHSENLSQVILRYALEFTGSPWGSLVIYDKNAESFRIIAEKGYRVEKISYPLATGIVGRVIRTNESVIVANTDIDPDYISVTEDFARSQLSVPLIHKDETLGAITLESPEYDKYTETDERFISQISRQAAIAMQNAKLFSDVTSGRDRLAAVLNAVDDGVLMVGLSGEINIANPRIGELVGMKSENMLGTKLTDLPDIVLESLGLFGSDADFLLYNLELGRISPSSKIVHTTHQKRERVLECSTAPVRGEDEKVIGLIIVAHDVTEEHEINKARELITHTIIHDLKSPMGAITSALHLIDDVTSEQPTRDDVIDQSLDIAQRSSQKVISLAESLLDIAKMQSGEMKINREPADLNAMIRQLGVDFIPQARTLNVVINIELSNDIPIFDMDQSKISRVLTNLVDNALKFTPTGGEIKITAMLEMDSALVCVADNGPGVPEEYREKVFEQFTQVPGTRGRRRGSGLGLTFCRLTVEGHGGRIWVDSEDGNGSVFKFSLPITAPDLDEETHPTIK